MIIYIYVNGAVTKLHCKNLSYKIPCNYEHTDLPYVELPARLMFTCDT